MPAQLVALNDGPSILLDKPILLLGRHPECDIQIDSRKVSRRHCCIAQVNDYLVVRDLGSTNGIRINGVRVLEGSLRPGDELTIGNHRYEVKWPADGNGPAPALGKPASMEGPPVDAKHASLDEPVALPEPRKARPDSADEEPSERSESSPVGHERPDDSDSLSDILPLPPK